MNLTALQAKVYLLTKTNSGNFPSSDLNQALNNALERVVRLINNADSRWQWDDDTQTDLPIATATITSGQQDYSLATSHLSIDRVEIKHNGAPTFTLLTSIDQHDKLLALDNVSTGTPTEYDKLGSSVLLYPIPNYTQDASIKIYFTRGPVALSTGGDVPGINSLFHDLLAYHVAHEHAISNGFPSAALLGVEIERREKALYDFYGHRSRDERPRIGVRANNR